MTEALLLIGCVIALCTLMGRFLDRLAVPSLLIFIALAYLVNVRPLSKL